MLLQCYSLVEFYREIHGGKKHDLYLVHSTCLELARLCIEDIIIFSLILADEKLTQRDQSTFSKKKKQKKKHT